MAVALSGDGRTTVYIERSKGPFCQSCGMPLSKAADFGTGTDGRRVNDYCRFCFAGGRFTEPDLSVDGMIEHCVDFTVRQSFTTETDARALLRAVIPGLKRWRTELPAG